MKRMPKFTMPIVSTSLLAMMASSAVHAGSFSLYTESSAAAIGNYAAGIAAEAADASTGWYNPAGLPLLDYQQLVTGLVLVSPSAKLTGTSNFTTQGSPSYLQFFSNLNGAKVGYVPSLHYARPMGENMGLGFSVVAPYGLATEWDLQGPVRYAATTSNLVTINAAPEIGGRLTEHFSLGLGVDFQFAKVRFNRMLGAPALLQRFNVPRILDSLSYNRGRSFGVGFHAGIMALFNEEHTRIGLNYQSQMRHRFNGYSRLQGRLAGIAPTITPAAVFAASPDSVFFSSNLASNNIIFPDVATLSIYQDLSERFAVLGSAVYTGWSSLKSLELQRVAAFAPMLGQTLVNSATTEDYRNVWRFALGANFKVNQALMLRVGGGWDQTPTVDEFRDVRIPDTNRWAASVGAHYQLRPNVGVDFGYTHLFSAGHYQINRSDVAGSNASYRVHADINARADLIGVQAVWMMDQPIVMPTK